MTGLQKTLIFLALLAAVVLEGFGFLTTVLYYAFLAGAAITALAATFLVGASVSVAEDDVYAVLSSTEWKTALELEKELRALKRVPQPWRQITGIRRHLEHLQRDQLIEAQERDLSEEQRQRRGGCPQSEFRKTAKSEKYPRRKREILLKPATDIA